MKSPGPNGVIVVDKPEGWTSHDVVAKCRGIAKTRSVGHLGTLDPIATGVLPLIVGNATRLARFFTKATKTYEATIRFGFATDTYDRAGTAVSVQLPPPGEQAILLALVGFTGPIQQIPPQYSAKKVGGVAAYASARKHIKVELTPIEVEIFELRFVSYEAPDLTVAVSCSAGTYIRTLAHDLGQVLGCGAYLQELRRTVSGDFHIEQAYTLPALQVLSDEGRLDQALLPAASLLPEIPNVYVDAETEGCIRQGRNFHVSPFRQQPGTLYVKALTSGEKLLAVGELAMPNVYHPILVLA